MIPTGKKPKPSFPDRFELRLIIGGAIAIAIIMLMSTVAALLYYQSIMPEYRAQARFKIFRQRLTVGREDANDSCIINDGNDFNWPVAVMQSTDIINRVAKRLSPEERKEVLAPYQDGNVFTGPLNQKEVLARCRQIIPELRTYIVTVRYTHPNRALAIKMANYFVEEIQRANEMESSVIIDPMVERLNIQLQQIKQDVADLTKKRNALVGAKDRGDVVARDEYEALSKEIKIREDNYTVLSLAYERKRADQANSAAPIKLIEPATAGDRPANKNLWTTLFAGWTIGAIISGVVGIALGVFMGFRRGMSASQKSGNTAS